MEVLRKINQKINSWAASFEIVPSNQLRSRYDVELVQTYANNQLKNQQGKLVNIGSGGDTGVLKEGEQGVTFGFGYCVLIAGTSKSSKSGFMIHQDTRDTWHSEMIDRNGFITDMFIQKFANSTFAFNPYPLKALGYGAYTP